MSRTRHHSVDGAYKRTTTVLQELSSDILNGVRSGNVKENTTYVKEETTVPREAKEEISSKYPQKLDFGNATNFMINFNTK